MFASLVEHLLLSIACLHAHVCISCSASLVKQPTLHLSRGCDLPRLRSGVSSSHRKHGIALEAQRSASTAEKTHKFTTTPRLLYCPRTYPCWVVQCCLSLVDSHCHVYMFYTLDMWDMCAKCMWYEWRQFRHYGLHTALSSS